MPLASGSEADFASRVGGYQAPDRSNTSQGGRYRPRWQTVFSGEVDISRRARSVYRSVTGESPYHRSTHGSTLASTQALQRFLPSRILASCVRIGCCWPFFLMSLRSSTNSSPYICGKALAMGWTSKLLLSVERPGMIPDHSQHGPVSFIGRWRIRQ